MATWTSPCGAMREGAYDFIEKPYAPARLSRPCAARSTSAA
jgi:FixJ family two-component response regulator